MEQEPEVVGFEMETSAWGMAGMNMCSQIVDCLMNEGLGMLTKDLEVLPMPGFEEPNAGEGEGIDVMSVSAEFFLTWCALEASPFCDPDGKSLPIKSMDPTRRVAPGVQVNQINDCLVQRAFAMFCVWLSRFLPINGEYTLARPVEPYRSRLAAQIGLGAWAMPWVDHLGFARWAWSKGLIQPRDGWKSWAALDPFTCRILDRPVPEIKDDSGMGLKIEEVRNRALQGLENGEQGGGL